MRLSSSSSSSTYNREGNGTPLQYSCLENPMDGGAWKAAVHGVAEGWTWLSNFPFTFHFHALEKEMATHSSVLAWRIPGTGEPGRLPSTGSHRVGQGWSDLAAAPTIHMYSYHAVWGQQSHKEAEHKPRLSSKEIYKPTHWGKADWVNSDRSETVEEPWLKF